MAAAGKSMSHSSRIASETCVLYAAVTPIGRNRWKQLRHRRNSAFVWPSPRDDREGLTSAQAPPKPGIERAEIGKFRLTASKPLDETATLWLVAHGQSIVPTQPMRKWSMRSLALLASGYLFAAATAAQAMPRGAPAPSIGAGVPVALAAAAVLCGMMLVRLWRRS